MVVLSACESGIGDTLSSGRVESLANAFLHAEAGSVVSSLWRVDDGSTKELMGEFYRFFTNGRSSAVALAEAQRSMIKRGHLPSRWAGFIVSEWSGSDS